MPLRHSARIIERPRVFAALQRAYDFPLTLVYAGPGYGKTTAIAQFTGRVPGKVVWHTVDDTQRDLYNLHLAALEAISQTFPQLDVQPPAPNASPKMLAKTIARFLSRQVETVWYVLDDMQFVSDAPGADAWLTALMLALPHNVHVIAASRTIPTFLTSEVITLDIHRIREDMLRFDEAEVALLARTLNEGTPASEQALRVAARLEGWPAGLTAALQTRPTRQIETELAPLDAEERFTMLARRLFDAQTPVMQSFLLQASALPALEPELLIDALQIPGALGLKDQAIRANLFVTPVSDGAALHGLFREFLDDMYRERLPDARRETYLRLGRWYEGRIAIDEAILAYLNGDAPDEAHRLIEIYARTTFDQGRYEALFRWQGLLAAHDTVSGWLSYLCGTVSTLRLDTPAAARDLARATEAFAALQDNDGLARVALVEAHGMLLRGEATSQAIAIGEAVLAQGDTISSEVQAGALRLIGRALLYTSAADALPWLQRARPLYEQYCDRLAYAKLLNDLDIAYRQVGAIDQATACLSDLVTIHREMPGQIGLAEALNQFGSFLYQTGDLRAAQHQLHEGLDRAIRTGDTRVEGYLSATLADVERDRGDMKEAERLYQRALELAGTEEPYLRTSALLGMATMLRWMGNPHDAAQNLAEVLLLAQAHRYEAERALALIGQSALAPFGEASRDPFTRIAGAVAILERANATPELAFACVVRAHLRLHERDLPGYETEMEALLTLMGGQPLVQMAIAEICMSQAGLNALARLPQRRFQAIRDRVMAMQRQRVSPANIIQMHPTPTVPLTAHTITVETLGAERYIFDGTIVLFTEWKAESARRMFVSLLVEGPQRMETLSLKLYPTVDNARQLSSNFHTTLHRARQVLGQNAIEKIDDEYRINPDLRVVCDALLFEQAIEDARAHTPSDRPAVHLWTSAIDRYKGDFLLGCYMDWAQTYRERLQKLYLDALERLADLFLKVNVDPHAALEMYFRVLDTDYFREPVHRQLMMTMIPARQKARIGPHFEEMKRRWINELGHLPEPETFDLVNNLLA